MVHECFLWMGSVVMHARAAVALVADDHELYRAGLSRLLKDSLGFDEVFEVATFRDAVARLNATPLISLATFDLAITGMDGAASLQLVRRLRPALPIAVITGSKGRDNLQQSLTSGVQGYAPKTLCAAELAQGLQTVLDGRLFVPHVPFEAAAIWSEGAGESVKSESTPVELTPRQRQVVRLIAQGRSNKEIARALQLAEGTIKVHVNALYRTLSVNNRASAVAAIAHQNWQRAS
jgi:DNA-binding NarL/FixJ family response regulator